VSSRSIVITGQNGCNVDPNNYGTGIGTRLMNTSKLLDATYQQNNTTEISACVNTSNFASMLDDVARDVSKPTDRFELQNANFDESTLEVYVNGHKKTRDVEWKLQGTSIVFTASAKPALSESVRIVYMPKFVLSVTPDLSNLVVTVDDVQVPQDSLNGWSYVASNNTLRFNGNSQPKNHSTVKVSYTGN
jgi:hypothetical protein